MCSILLHFTGCAERTLAVAEVGALRQAGKSDLAEKVVEHIGTRLHAALKPVVRVRRMVQADFSPLIWTSLLPGFVSGIGARRGVDLSM